MSRDSGKFGFYFRNRGSRVWGMKYVLPLLLIALSGFAQDSPKLDPNTGLPTPGKGKKAETRAERTARYLASVLQGASRTYVEPVVVDGYGNLPEGLKAQIETKLKLGMKRNKLSLEPKLNPNIDSWSMIRIEISHDTFASGKSFGYTYRVRIGRWAYVGPNKRPVNFPMFHRVSGGGSPDKGDLKDAIDSALDTIFLAYLELPEPKKK